MARLVETHVLLLLLALGWTLGSGCARSGKGRGNREERLPSAGIVLDPGHGGKDGGACLKGGTPEKTIVLDIALQVEGYLKQRGLPVVLTRRTDEFVSLSERAKVATDRRAALFVSIHANSCDREDVEGFEIYHAGNRWQGKSVRAAEFIRRFFREATGARDRGVKEHGYAVLSGADCPSVLVEVGYLSNPREATLLSGPTYRAKVARGIARGIIAYSGSLR